MAHAITNTNLASDTWRAMVVGHNQVCLLITQNVVTASANSSGELTTGNVAVNGQIQANVIVTANLQGGVLGTPANLLITTNVDIGTSNIFSVRIPSGLIYVNGSIVVANQVSMFNLLVGNSTVNGVANVYGNGSVVGTLTVNNLVVTGNSTLTPNTSGQLVVKSSITVFIANGTYTKNANLVWADIVVIGAGGPGGSVTGTANSTGTQRGAGGSGSGTAYKKLANSTVRATEPIIIGIANTSTGTQSKFGNSTSTFTQLISAPGNAGSPINPGQSGLHAIQGGIPTGGDLNIPGGCPTMGYDLGTVTVSGGGGDSQFGKGGAHGGANSSSAFYDASDLSGPGPGSGYGAGGAGSATSNTVQSKNGGPGSNGVVIVTEYYLG